MRNVTFGNNYIFTAYERNTRLYETHQNMHYNYLEFERRPDIHDQ